jgi:hypothetical protein
VDRSSVRQRSSASLLPAPPSMHNYVDFIPDKTQYLGIEIATIHFLGWQSQIKAMQGKIVHGGNFMPAKKKAAKKKKH